MHSGLINKDEAVLAIGQNSKATRGTPETDEIASLPLETQKKPESKERPNGVYVDLKQYLDEHKIVARNPDDSDILLYPYSVLLAKLREFEPETQISVFEREGQLLLMLTHSNQTKRVTHELLYLSEHISNEMFTDTTVNISAYDCVVAGPNGVVSAKKRGGEGVGFQRILLQGCADPESTSHTDDFYYHTKKHFIGYSSFTTMRNIESIWHELGHSHEPRSEEDIDESLRVNRTIFLVRDRLESGAFTHSTFEEIEQRTGMEYFYARFLRAQRERNASEWALTDFHELSEILELHSIEMGAAAQHYEESWQTYDASLLPLAAVSEKAREYKSQEMENTVRKMLESFLELDQNIEYLNAREAPVVIRDPENLTEITFGRDSGQISLIVQNGPLNLAQMYYLSPYLDFEAKELLFETPTRPQQRTIQAKFCAFLPSMEKAYTEDELRQTQEQMQCMLDESYRVVVLVDDRARRRIAFLTELDTNLTFDDPLTTQLRLEEMKSGDAQLQDLNRSIKVMLNGAASYSDTQPLTRLEVIAGKMKSRMIELLGTEGLNGAGHQFAYHKFNPETGEHIVTKWSSLVVGCEQFLRNFTDYDVNKAREHLSQEDYEKEVIKVSYQLATKMRGYQGGKRKIDSE